MVKPPQNSSNIKQFRLYWILIRARSDRDVKQNLSNTALHKITKIRGRIMHLSSLANKQRQWNWSMQRRVRSWAAQVARRIVARVGRVRLRWAEWRTRSSRTAQSLRRMRAGLAIRCHSFLFAPHSTSRSPPLTFRSFEMMKRKTHCLCWN